MKNHRIINIPVNPDMWKKAPPEPKDKRHIRVPKEHVEKLKKERKMS